MIKKRKKKYDNNMPYIKNSENLVSFEDTSYFLTIRGADSNKETKTRKIPTNLGTSKAYWRPILLEEILKMIIEK